MKKGFVQLLPLVLLAAFAVTTLVIANRVQKEQQEIRSQAGAPPFGGGGIGAPKATTPAPVAHPDFGKPAAPAPKPAPPSIPLKIVIDTTTPAPIKPGTIYTVPTAPPQPVQPQAPQQPQPQPQQPAAQTGGGGGGGAPQQAGGGVTATCTIGSCQYYSCSQKLTYTTTKCATRIDSGFCATGYPKSDPCKQGATAVKNLTNTVSQFTTCTTECKGDIPCIWQQCFGGRPVPTPTTAPSGPTQQQIAEVKEYNDCLKKGGLTDAFCRDQYLSTYVPNTSPITPATICIKGKYGDTLEECQKKINAALAAAKGASGSPSKFGIILVQPQDNTKTCVLVEGGRYNTYEECRNALAAQVVQENVEIQNRRCSVRGGKCFIDATTCAPGVAAIEPPSNGWSDCSRGICCSAPATAATTTTNFCEFDDGLRVLRGTSACSRDNSKKYSCNKEGQKNITTCSNRGCASGECLPAVQDSCDFDGIKVSKNQGICGADKTKVYYCNPQANKLVYSCDSGFECKDGSCAPMPGSSLPFCADGLSCSAGVLVGSSRCRSPEGNQDVLLYCCPQGQVILQGKCVASQVQKPIAPSQNKLDVTGAVNPACCTFSSDCPSGQTCDVRNGACKSGFSCRPPTPPSPQKTYEECVRTSGYTPAICDTLFHRTAASSATACLPDTANAVKSAIASGGGVCANAGNYDCCYLCPAGWTKSREGQFTRCLPAQGASLPPAPTTPQPVRQEAAVVAQAGKPNIGEACRWGLFVNLGSPGCDTCPQPNVVHWSGGIALCGPEPPKSYAACLQLSANPTSNYAKTDCDALFPREVAAVTARCPDYLKEQYSGPGFVCETGGVNCCNFCTYGKKPLIGGGTRCTLKDEGGTEEPIRQYADTGTGGGGGAGGDCTKEDADAKKCNSFGQMCKIDAKAAYQTGAASFTYQPDASCPGTSSGGADGSMMPKIGDACRWGLFVNWGSPGCDTCPNPKDIYWQNSIALCGPQPPSSDCTVLTLNQCNATRHKCISYPKDSSRTDYGYRFSDEVDESCPKVEAPAVEKKVATGGGETIPAVGQAPSGRFTPPPTDRSVAPPNSVLLPRGIGLTDGTPQTDGKFQVEWWCKGFGYEAYTDGTNWFCRKTVDKSTVSQLTETQFDTICRVTYTNQYAFAIHDGKDGLESDRWRCYGPATGGVVTTVAQSITSTITTAGNVLISLCQAFSGGRLCKETPPSGIVPPGPEVTPQTPAGPAEEGVTGAGPSAGVESGALSGGQAPSGVGPASRTRPRPRPTPTPGPGACSARFATASGTRSPVGWCDGSGVRCLYTNKFSTSSAQFITVQLPDPWCDQEGIPASTCTGFDQRGNAVDASNQVVSCVRHPLPDGTPGRCGDLTCDGLVENWETCPTDCPSGLKPPPSVDQRNALPAGSSLLDNGIGLTNSMVEQQGNFQVEGYCKKNADGTFRVIRNDADWFCIGLDGSQRKLGPLDFDVICRKTYRTPGAFAIKSGTNTVAAFNWRCYAYPGQ